MTGIYLACYIASHIRIPERFAYLFLTIALVAAISAFSLATGNETAASSQAGSREEVVPHAFESSTEANGSIDPYAPFYGEGDMIEQTIGHFNQHPLNHAASGACILPVYCW